MVILLSILCLLSVVLPVLIYVGLFGCSSKIADKNFNSFKEFVAKIPDNERYFRMPKLMSIIFDYLFADPLFTEDKAIFLEASGKSKWYYVYESVMRDFFKSCSESKEKEIKWTSKKFNPELYYQKLIEYCNEHDSEFGDYEENNNTTI